MLSPAPREATPPEGHGRGGRCAPLVTLVAGSGNGAATVGSGPGAWGHCGQPGLWNPRGVKDPRVSRTPRGAAEHGQALGRAPGAVGGHGRAQHVAWAPTQVPDTSPQLPHSCPRGCQSQEGNLPQGGVGVLGGPDCHPSPGDPHCEHEWERVMMAGAAPSHPGPGHDEHQLGRGKLFPAPGTCSHPKQRQLLAMGLNRCEGGGCAPHLVPAA